jgi:hypothetical protein
MPIDLDHQHIDGIDAAINSTVSLLTNKSARRAFAKSASRRSF